MRPLDENLGSRCRPKPLPLAFFPIGPDGAGRTLPEIPADAPLLPARSKIPPIDPAVCGRGADFLADLARTSPGALRPAREGRVPDRPPAEAILQKDPDRKKKKAALIRPAALENRRDPSAIDSKRGIL